MTWEPPQVNIRPISRAAYGFDPQGQLVSDISAPTLRAIGDAMQQALEEGLAVSGETNIKEARQKALNAWLKALNLTTHETDLFSEAWVKGTMHMYSTEFFYLADTYARQICAFEESYLKHLALALMPHSLIEAGKSLSLQQLYKTFIELFPHTIPLDLTLAESGQREILIGWRSTSAQTRLASEYRADFTKSIQSILQTLLANLPVLLREETPATIEARRFDDDVLEWRVRWRQPLQIPPYVLLGAAASIVLLVAALAGGIMALGVVAVIPVLLGISWNVYQIQRRQATVHENALLNQIEYNQLQSLELTTVYASLRSTSHAHERQIQDLITIREAVMTLSSLFDQERLLDDLLKVMTESLRFDRALVLMQNREKEAIGFGAISHPPNEPEDQMRLNNLRIYLEDDLERDPLVGKWVKGKSVLVNDPSLYFNSRMNWLLAMLEFNQFYSVPLMLGETILGVVLVDNHFTRAPIRKEDQSLVDALATNIAIAMENARLYHLQDTQLSISLEEAKTLERIDRELSDTLETEYVLDLLLDWALRFTTAHIATVMLVDEVAGTGRIAAFLGCTEEQLPGGKRGVVFSLRKAGISGRTALNSETQIVADVSTDHDYVTLAPQVQSQLSAPVIRNGRVVAVISLESYQEDGFTPEHVTFTERLATRAGVALENARLFTESQQERNKLSAILTHTTDAVIVVDEIQKLMLINHAALQVFGFSGEANDYINKNFKDIFGTTALASFYNDFREKRAERNKELELHDRTYHCSMVQVEDVGHTIILHDITPLVEVDRLKDELVQSVSHDLKNPLAVMKGYVDLLDMTQSLNERGRKYMNQIGRAIEGMQELIDNLLDLAKIDSGLVLQQTPLDIRELIREIEEDAAVRARQKGVEFVNQFAPDLPSVFGDEVRIKQVVTNLVSNAVKYTLNASDIIVDAHQENGFVKVVVQDHGVGIPPEDIPTVWDRFVRLRSEQTKDIEGTGLGLAIVKSLVEAHGGKVGLESIENEGSTFWFTLPIATQDMIEDLPGNVNIRQ